MIKSENIRITITIPKALHKLLKINAKYEDRSVGNLAARILKKYYNLNEDNDVN